MRSRACFSERFGIKPNSELQLDSDFAQCLRHHAAQQALWVEPNPCTPIGVIRVAHCATMRPGMRLRACLQALRICSYTQRGVHGVDAGAKVRVHYAAACRTKRAMCWTLVCADAASPAVQQEAPMWQAWRIEHSRRAASVW